MTTQSKKVHGQLLDRSNRDIVAEVSVNVSLIQSQDPVVLPEYRVTMTTDGYKPELDNKSYILSLSEKISGDVFISIAGIPNKIQTRFTVNLKDSVWYNLEWFQSL